MVSSMRFPRSATRSWLSRASFLTRRPKRMIGTITSGTPASVSNVSLRLVVNSIARPPTSSKALRSAIDKPEPITFSICVVSEVSREMTSPVRPASNHEGGRLRR